MADNDKDDDKPDRLKLTITGLTPDKDYALQVRAFNENGHSPWSDNFKFITINDSSPLQGEGQGAPNRPRMITGITWVATEQGYLAEWNPVIRDGFGNRIVVKHYEIEVTYLNVLDKDVAIVPSGDGRQSRLFTWSELQGFFGEPPPKLRMKIRVVNSANNRSLWSDPLEASAGKPDPPTDPKTIVPINDGIEFTWTPPANMANVIGYRVYVGSPLAGPDFAAGHTNRVYEGTAPGFTFSSGTYATHYFKIRSYSASGAESDDLLAEGAPKSPFGADLTPPKAPVITGVTVDQATKTANVSWTFDGNDPLNKDAAAFILRYRKTGAQFWEYQNFSKEVRSGGVPLRFSNASYEFQMAASDVVGNHPPYQPEPPFKSPSAFPGPPPKTTNLVSTPSLFGISLSWDKNPHGDVEEGGHYEVNIATSPDFVIGGMSYVTANTYLELVGLEVGTTYYSRVRAVDSEGEKGAWSDTDVESTGTFPEPEKSDGVPPASSPSARVAPNMGFLAVSWDAITNNDFVTYEVHVSENSAFTPTKGSTATLLTTSSGTSVTASNMPNGTPFDPAKTYYFRIIATDIDTTPANAPAPGAVASGKVKTIGPSDLGINMAGENLYYNSSFDADSNGDGVADYWSVYVGNPTPAVTRQLVAGRTGGYAQRLAWTSSNVPILYSNATGTVVKPHTEYALSFYAKASGGNGFRVQWNTQPVAGSVKWLSNPKPLANEFQRYIVVFKTGATVDSGNAFITIDGHPSGSGEFIIDDAQIEAGDMASAYKTGTVSIAKLATGRFSTAEFILGSGGIIKSDNYNATNKTGFALSESQLILHDGVVNAKSLQTGSAIIGNLFIGDANGGSLTVAGGGEIKSADYNGDPANGALKGYRLTAAGLDIAKGVIRAETITGNIISPDIKIGVNGRITIDDSGSIRSNTYSYNPATDTGTGWKMDRNGIEIWGSTSLIRAEAFKGGTFSGHVFNVGGGGWIGSENYSAAARQGWRIGMTPAGNPEANFFLGKIYGATVETDQLMSALSTQAADGGVRRVFSINQAGYAEFQGLRIFSSAVVGDPNPATWAGAHHHNIRSANYTQGQEGWIIHGNGYAEFNSGTIRVGAPGGGASQLMNNGGVGELRFYLPDTTGRYHYIRTLGLNEFGIFGAAGGHVKFYGGASIGNGEGGTQWLENMVGISQNLYVTNFTVLDNGIRVNGGGMKVRGGLVSYGGVHSEGEIKFPGLGGEGGQTGVTVGNAGVLSRASSSRRYKDNIKPLEISTDTILSLEPKSFKWNTENMGYAEDIGFIAEEAHDLGLTDYVSYTRIKGKKVPDGFKYHSYVTALQHVVREQHEEIQSMKSRLEALEARA